VNDARTRFFFNDENKPVGFMRRNKTKKWHAANTTKNKRRIEAIDSSLYYSHDSWMRTSFASSNKAEQRRNVPSSPPSTYTWRWRATPWWYWTYRLSFRIGEGPSITPPWGRFISIVPKLLWLSNTCSCKKGKSENIPKCHTRKSP
jgi:hypothetical protein